METDKHGNVPTTRHFGRVLPVTALGVALIATISLAAAGLGTRLDLWHFRTGFAILKYSAYGGLLAAALALTAAIVAFRGKYLPGFVLSLVALALGITVVALPLSWQSTARKLPRIHDITTDIVNPPRFVAILPLRAKASNPAEYSGPEIAAKQREAYPDVKTVVLGVASDQAFALALDAARRMGWRIVAALPAEGRIEATDTTFWFGFTDDIVVRITPAGDRSLVDVRSVSRVGVSDVGTNARRIRSFLKKLEGSG
ncbi:DUF1499 domain-containing protein [Geomobilimonas luticola]|uniref:DUF1499 domain-containing protein n=1 Tax=Geomobilimonas luticola TaxID=1114878 RepID=A0ABS5SHU5_9BACT|nr:DUF1499 domain-containing protein [Geomobilimonas luticola]MBT0654332.1 DUF1499 domain-containing protein [Geomobilimonas luticola]